jgi:hypothetical protein
VFPEQGQTLRLDRNTLSPVVFALLFLFTFSDPAPCRSEGPVVLDNEHLRIEVNLTHGTIAHIADKPGKIQLVSAAGLADNFRLFLRGADNKTKVILGRHQKLSQVTQGPGTLDLAWEGPLFDTEGGKHNLRVRMPIRLAGPTLSAHDRANRSQVLHLELQPGNAESLRWDGNWPRPEELNGLPAGLLISFVDFAYFPPGKTYEAAPVILQFHKGDWQEGQRIYWKWKNQLK